MMNKRLSTLFLIYMMSFSTVAEENAVTDLSSIEKQERAQIISELTYRLETSKNCTQTLNWTDAGSGADKDGYFFIPKIGKAEYMIGGHVSHKVRSKSHCVTTVKVAANNPKETPPLLVAPGDWKQVWKDSGSGATKDGSLWKAIAPDKNYRCIGSVSQLGHNQKPDLPNYRCVHKSLTDKITTKTILWSDKGSNAKQKVTVFRLPATGAYIAVASRKTKIKAFDLKKNAASVPNAKKVNAILATRMAPLKADIEAKTKAIQEQKAAEKNTVAKKAEQQKIAAAEKKQQEKAAEQKALALQAEKEAEAESLIEEEQARIAKAMEEKVAEQAEEQEPVVETKEAIAEIPVELEESAAEVEHVAQQQTPQISEETDSDTALSEVKDEAGNESPNESPSESKGLSDIMSFFLKVLGLMVGGVIIFMIAFKVLFGKKESK